MMNLLYILLAAFGLGFLVFIHELGHYFIARRVGMRVEAFGIGFGKPIYTWERKGVKWNICWLPFGGYVRIAGMEKEGTVEPSMIPDGFYGKKPSARIKVALAGPFVNIVFAFIAFTLLWMAGGREKSFSEYTHLVGMVDSQSKLYELGVRPGDEIAQYNHSDFEGAQDFLFSGILDSQKSYQISGYKIDYFKQSKEPFNYNVEGYQNPLGVIQQQRTVGISSLANYLIYRQDNPLPEGSPMLGSGIEFGDRVISIDGRLVFSLADLMAAVNEPKALLTVERGGETFLTRVPRLKIADLRLDPAGRAEFDDWQHEAGLKTKAQQLFFIPYNLTADCVVQNPYLYVDEQSQEHIFAPQPRVALETALQKGDRILAVDGSRVSTSYELLAAIQARKVQVIVQRGADFSPISWKVADQQFYQGINWRDLSRLITTIGSENRATNVGNLYLLPPITPRPLPEFPRSASEQTRLTKLYEEQKKQFEKLENLEQRAVALRQLEESQKRLAIGLHTQDRKVIYNPYPWTLFSEVVDQTWRTLSALVTGTLSPKWMSGPVGIVQVMHTSWMQGIQEALYWLALISMNLGILNLLPIPVLDGGHICFALWEMITKKPLKAKTMERLVVPFIVLLVGFLVYITFQDILRLIIRFF